MGLAIGLGLGLTFGTGGGYEPEASALFARFTTPPTDARKTLINTLIKALKTSNVWAKLDALYIFAAADSQAARRNWVQNLYNVTPSASPTFTIDRGYQGDGAAASLSTGFNPSSAGGKFALNDAHAMVWVLNNVAEDKIALGSGTDAVRIDPRRVDNNVLGRMNDTTNLAKPVATSAGMTLIRRLNSTEKTLRRDKTQLNTAATVSVAMPASFIQVLSGSSIFSNFQSMAASIGSALTDAESDALYDAINAYKTAVGA